MVVEFCAVRYETSMNRKGAKRPENYVIVPPFVRLTISALRKIVIIFCTQGVYVLYVYVYIYIETYYCNLVCFNYDKRRTGLILFNGIVWP